MSVVKYDLTDGTQAWLSFEMESKTGVTYVSLIDKAYSLTGIAGGGGGGSFSIGSFISDLYYNEFLPQGPLIVDLFSISVHLPGHWEARWTFLATKEQTASAPQLSACLTRESWRQALQAHSPFLAGFSGILALFGLVLSINNYGASIVHLDGSDRKSLGFGSEPSLALDGSRVVYVGPVDKGPSDGLYIIDLASGNRMHVPNTSAGDMHPLWSPDGSTIAFTRGPSSGLIGAPGPYHIIVMDNTGSNLRQLTQGTIANYAMAWMPDGNRLLHTVASRDGASLQMMDVHTGESSALTDLNYNGNFVVSLDGK